MRTRKTRRGTIAGLKIANPCALLLTSAQMLSHLGMQDRADRLHAAITATIAAADRTTPDLGGSGNTETFTDAILRGFELYKPIIAAVNGNALGGGTEMMNACDLRVASDNAVFGTPEAKVGLLPGGGSISRLHICRGRQMVSTGVGPGTG